VTRPASVMTRLVWFVVFATACAGKFNWSASTQSGSSAGSASTDEAAAFKAGGSYGVQKNRVLQARTRVDADPKNPDTVETYATVVMDVYNTAQAEEDKSVDWSEHARRAIGLAKDAAVTATTPERKARFHLLRGILLKYQQKPDDALSAFDESWQAVPRNVEPVGWMLEIHAAQKAPAATNEKLCKRVRKSLTETKEIYDLIGRCAQWHPKREQVDPILDMASLVPWVNPRELKEYKRSLGEEACGGDKLRDCMAGCHCDPAEVRCSCHEQCKLDRNKCLVPYLN
jgi:hypothetical protein